MKEAKTINQLLFELVNLFDLLITLTETQNKIESILIDLEQDETDDTQQVSEIDRFFNELKTEDDFNSFNEYFQYLSTMKQQLTEKIKDKPK